MKSSPLASAPLNRQALLTPAESPQRYEVINGQLEVSSIPSTIHQLICRRLLYRLMKELEELGTAYVFHAPTEVMLNASTSVFPDLAVVRCSRHQIISHQAIEGCPDLIIEVTSPNSEKRDLTLKRYLYAQAGVPEYWIVHPRKCVINRMHDAVPEQGQYATRTPVHVHEAIHSTEFPDLSIPLEGIFRPL